MDDFTKQLIADFVEESQGIIDQLREIVEGLENLERPPSDFALFGQRIDGIMGCAKTMGLEGIPDLALAIKVIGQQAEGCKLLGYKASQMSDPNIIKMVAAFLADALEMVDQATQDLKTGKATVDAKQAARTSERINFVAGRLRLSEDDQKQILRMFGLS